MGQGTYITCRTTSAFSSLKKQRTGPEQPQTLEGEKNITAGKETKDRAPEAVL